MKFIGPLTSGIAGCHCTRFTIAVKMKLAMLKVEPLAFIYLIFFGLILIIQVSVQCQVSVSQVKCQMPPACVQVDPRYRFSGLS